LAEVELEVPPRSVYVGVVRLAISALGRSLELDEDDVQDLKIAVSEACANAVIAHEEAHSDESVKVAWRDEDGRIEVTVESKGKPTVDPGTGPLTDSGSLASRDVLSLALLESLVDDCQVEELPGGGSVTRLIVSPSA
jgi:serine/threonine-protein kinase RsbW